MPRKRYIFKNEFHGTEAATTLKDGVTRLSRSQLKSLNVHLCGKGIGCTCHGQVLKVTGPQTIEWREVNSVDKFGWFETIEILGKVEK